jgi:hypothetical protein
MVSRESRAGLAEIVALVAALIIREAFLSRWLPPLASALAAALIVGLVWTPFYVWRHTAAAPLPKRLMVYVLFMAIAVYIVARVTGR